MLQIYFSIDLTFPFKCKFNSSIPIDFLAPRMYPTEIHVGSHGSQSVYVTWRGVTTGIEEEPIQGYIVSDRNAIAEF